MLTEDLNTEFCKECDIKKASCCIINKETGEIRFYTSPTGIYKKPAGWTKIQTVKFDTPRYPNLIENPFNFSALINIQWELFGEVGDAYKRTGDETFEYNYVRTRLSAIKMCKSFGGGEMLDMYKEAIRNTLFDYME